MKKILSLLLAFISVFYLYSCSNKEFDITKDSYTIEIEIQQYGTITAVLDAKTAPITVQNFLTLVQSGFYEGISFHRIENGFVMQGGDPDGDGFGGSDKTIKGEFAANGIENNISHTRGTLSMARTSESYDSASSQFFIMHQDNTGLDGQYAAFGRVTDGMDIVDKICENTPVSNNNGFVLEQYRPIIKEIRIIE